MKKIMSLISFSLFTPLLSFLVPCKHDMTSHRTTGQARPHALKLFYHSPGGISNRKHRLFGFMVHKNKLKQKLRPHSFRHVRKFLI